MNKTIKKVLSFRTIRRFFSSVKSLSFNMGRYFPNTFEDYQSGAVFAPRDEMVREKAVSITCKPQMRGLLKSSIKINLTMAVGAAIASGLIFKLAVADVRKRRYAEFYRTYDAEKEFETMRKKGLFQSC